MIGAFLSSSEPTEEQLREFVSKKLDFINNLQIYLCKNGDILLRPSDFPKSIISVIYALSLADYVLFNVGKEINSFDAELSLCIENSRVDQGGLVINDYSDTVSFEKFFSKYKVGGFTRVGSIAEVISKNTDKKFDFKYVSIDKHFIVKGIGSVIIGFVIGNQIAKGERLLLLPSLKQCSVKNIQIMDVDSAFADTGSHVGLALNNISEQDLSANYAVSSLDMVDDKMDGQLTMSPFYKEDPFLKQLSCSFLGEVLSVSLLKENDLTKIKFNKKIPKVTGKYLLVDPSLAMGRNRVVGNFEII
jgi:hypothetical protein